MSNVLDECQDFFAAIFDSSDVIEFRTLKPVTKNWGAPASLPAMVDKLLALNAREAQCYFGANPRKQSGESTESGVALARCLFADFDGGVTAEVARSRIKAAGLPMPTATVATGGGVHCWWRLVEPLLDSKRWNALQKALAETLQSDAAGTSGWPRIMRLPGFVNHKYDHKPVAALVDVDPSRLYSLAELSPSKKGMSSASRAFVDRGEVAPGRGRRETMFAVACDLRDRGWTPDAAEAEIMPRMRACGIPDTDLADCPRQIRNAWRREPRAIATSAPPATLPPAPCRGPSVAPWRPFPTAALPEPLASLVREIAAAVDCDPAVAGVPMLPVLAAAIGTTARIELKVGYEQPAILWACVVAPVGSAKSAPFKYVVTPTRDHDRNLRQETVEVRREYAAELEVHEAGLTAWRKGRASGRAESAPPERPEPPASRRAVVGDATVEALAEKLADNPRGLLLARDELSGWLGGLNRYRQGGSSGDEAFYLAAFEGEGHSVDRRTGDRREIDVPVAALSVVGTIQPGILRSLITTERRQNGLLARLLLTAPPGRPAKWTEAEVSFATRQAFADVIAKLYGLQPETDFDGKETPRIVRIAPAAKKLFVEWINRTAEEIAETHAEDLAGALSKLRNIAARIALVIHETRVAIGGKVDRHAVDEDSMSRALALAEWFSHETRRAYAILAETELDRADRHADDRLAVFVARQGGATAVRDVIAGCRWIVDADAGEKALQRLVDASLGRWIDKPPAEKGGRPSRLFVLDRETVSAQPAKSRAQMSCADADILQEVEIEPPGGYVDL